MHYRERQSGQTDYLMLLIVIVIGVTIGNLLSTFIIAKIAEYQIEQAAIEFTEELSVQNTEGQARLQEQQQMTQEQRANSRTGRFLSKSCEEWKVTNQRYDNPTSQQEMQKACQQYQRYLDTGYAAKTDFQ